MRTALLTTDVTVRPGEVTIVEVEVGNTSTVIDGITARVEGIDPTWVHLPVPVLSLFPDSTGVLPIHVQFPPATVVGSYLLVVHVESTIDPTRTTAHDLWLQVEPMESAMLALRPSVVTKGSTARYSAIVANTGNVTTDFTITALDETRVLTCAARPLTLTVPPGQEGVAAIVASGPRPWFGQAIARMILITARSGAVELKEVATFNQRPRIPRGALTLVVLALIVGMWAAIFLIGVDLLRGDDSPTKATATNFNDGGAAAVPLEQVAATVGGKVTAESTGDGVARTTVEAFRILPDGSSEATGSAATAEDGTFSLASLLPGTYKLRFTAEGFREVWYPAARTEAAAEPVDVDPLATVSGIDVAMRGRRGSIVGNLTLPDNVDPPRPIFVTVTPIDEEGGGGGGAPEPVVQRVVDGQLEVKGLPTPGTYRVRVAAKGFEPQEFRQTLDGGEAQVLNTVRLGAAPGSIAGRVVSSDGQPLGNVLVSLSSGDFEREATTPTAGDVGAFSIDGLETPRTYVLTFTREGFSGATIALDLGAGRARNDVTATLTGGSGTITGVATETSGVPLGGVAVTVTRGEFVAETATLTTGGAGAGVGSFTVTDVPTPGTYTVTFAAPGYVGESRHVSFLAPGVQPGVSVTMRAAQGTVTGRVTGGGAPLVGVGVELTDGRTARTTATASTPSGGYTFTDVAPGTYAITFATPDRQTRTVLVRVTAGEVVVRDVDLPAAG